MEKTIKDEDRLELIILNSRFFKKCYKICEEAKFIDMLYKNNATKLVKIQRMIPLQETVAGYFQLFPSYFENFQENISSHQKVKDLLEGSYETFFNENIKLITSTGYRQDKCKDFCVGLIMTLAVIYIAITRGIGNEEYLNLVFRKEKTNNNR